LKTDGTLAIFNLNTNCCFQKNCRYLKSKKDSEFIKIVHFIVVTSVTSFFSSISICKELECLHRTPINNFFSIKFCRFYRGLDYAMDFFIKILSPKFRERNLKTSLFYYNYGFKWRKQLFYLLLEAFVQIICINCFQFEVFNFLTFFYRKPWKFYRKKMVDRLPRKNLNLLLFL
jgi:hypothetical protein